MQAIYDEFETRNREVNEKYKNGQISGQGLTTTLANNISYLFPSLVNAGFYEEAKKHVSSYLGTFQNTDFVFTRSFESKLPVLEMFFKAGLKHPDPLRVCTNLELTELCSRYGMFNTSLPSVCMANALSLDDYASVKFIVENHKELIRFVSGSSGGIFHPKAKSPEILRLLIKHFGREIINSSVYEGSSYVWKNQYINEPEFMKVILEEIPDYHFSDLEIKDIKDIEILLKLKFKGYKIDNSLWTDHCNRGETILFHKGELSPIWMASIDKLERVRFSGSDTISLQCYWFERNAIKPGETKQNHFRDINRLVLKMYALYCLLNKHYDGLEDTSKKININIPYVSYENKHLIHFAIERMDIKAVKILKRLGCNIDVVVNNKDLRQYVYDLKSQAAQMDILRILDS